MMELKMSDANKAKTEVYMPSGNREQVGVLTRAVNGLVKEVNFLRSQLGWAYNDITEEEFDKLAAPFLIKSKDRDEENLASKIKILSFRVNMNKKFVT